MTLEMTPAIPEGAVVVHSMAVVTFLHPDHHQHIVTWVLQSENLDDVTALGMAEFLRMEVKEQCFGGGIFYDDDD